MTDPVEHPQHYESGPYECILLTECFTFNVGNCLKYVWRHKLKNHPLEDLRKARWYALRAISNGEDFAPAVPLVKAQSGGLRHPQYDWRTLLLIKADSVSDVREQDFWLAVFLNDHPGIETALDQLIKETQEHG